MNAVELRISPRFRDLIPPLGDEERQQLEANIIADGCRDPIVTWNGYIIDGHNRYEICTAKNLKFQIKPMQFADEDEACIWIIDNQKGRRNVSDIDKIALQEARAEILRKKGLKNKAHGETAPGKKKNAFGKIAKSVPVNTRAESAKAAGVGERTYDAGKLILEAASKGEIEPTVVEDVRRGRSAIHRVAKDIKEKRQREARKEKRVEAVASAPKLDKRIIVGDFRKHADKVADGSVSLIFTDPPYDRKATDLFPDLAKFAAAKLCEGGSLIFYVGHIQLPEAFAAFGKELRYWWPIACVHSGGKAVMREYGINACWKPMLWYVKGTRHDKSRMVNDVVSGGEEKTHHDWQQSQKEAEYWISVLTEQGDLVCDPFLGGGTTAAAAEGLGREWIGFEIDEANAKISSGRVA